MKLGDCRHHGTLSEPSYAASYKGSVIRYVPCNPKPGAWDLFGAPPKELPGLKTLPQQKRFWDLKSPEPTPRPIAGSGFQLPDHFCRLLGQSDHQTSCASPAAPKPKLAAPRPILDRSRDRLWTNCNRAGAAANF